MLSYFVVQFFPFVFENTHISIELVAIIICFSMVLHNPRNKNAKKRVKKKNLSHIEQILTIEDVKLNKILMTEVNALLRYFIEVGCL